MLRAAAAAGAIQLCGTARWSRALSRAESNQESAWFGGAGGGGGEPKSRSLQVVCVVILLLDPRFGPPSSSLPLGEEEEKRPHGIVGWPPACCEVGGCGRLMRRKYGTGSSAWGFVDGARVSPACWNLMFGVSGWGGGSIPGSAPFASRLHTTTLTWNHSKKWSKNGAKGIKNIKNIQHQGFPSRHRPEY